MILAPLTPASSGPSKIAAMLAYPRLKPAHTMPPWKTLYRFLLLVLSISLSALVAVAQPPHTTEAPQTVDGPLTATKTPGMNDDSVLKMVKAGLGDDLVIQTINTQPGQYVTDADSLVMLK